MPSPNGHNGHKRLINYRRVSSTDQFDAGHSLPDQLRFNQQYAAHLAGYTTLDADSHGPLEEDVSGAIRFDERPVGARVMRLLKAGKADGVLVHVADRLYRDLPEALLMVRDLLREGFEVHTTNLGRVNRETDIRFVIESWQAAEEREKIRDRTYRGRLSKARAGKWVGQGPAPYGYTRTGHQKTAELAIHPQQSKVVKLIFDLYTDPVKRTSIVGIARHLNLRGVRPPQYDQWSFTGVRKILDRSAYCGEFAYGLPEPIPIHLPDLAIVDPETFRRAQARRQENRRLNKRHAQRQYWLSGYLSCACGWRMYGMYNGWGKGYYYCNFQRSSSRSENTAHKKLGACNYRLALGMAEVDGEVWAWLKEVVRADTPVDELLAQQPPADSDDAREQLADLDARIVAARAKVRTLVAKFGDSEDPDVEAALEAAQQARDQLIDDREELAARAERTDAARRELATAAAQLAEFRRNVDEASFEEKRAALAVTRTVVKWRPGLDNTVWIDASCLFGKTRFKTSHTFTLRDNDS